MTGLLKPRALDLFCGAGGAAKGLQLAGFHVTGVDIKPQPRYCGDAFVQGDALNPPFDLSRFDFIWASPPCQAYSALKVMKNARQHIMAGMAMRDILTRSGIPWVIENVYGAPLRPGHVIRLCGTSFGLRSADDRGELRRHRYFETSWPVIFQLPCKHTQRITLGVYGGKVRNIAAEKRHYAKPADSRGAPDGVVLPQYMGQEAMGIDWMNIQELSEAIPPAYSHFIGHAAMHHISTVTKKTPSDRRGFLG